MFIFSGPAEVKGSFQKIRDVLHPILIAIFIFLPWIRINNKPIFLLDIFHRHFELFGRTFYSHDAPLIFFLVIILLLGIFIVTAIFGRLWCGWTCPQTVFIQGLFNKIEKLILGSYSKRVLLFRSEDTLARKMKITFVLVVFFILSWMLSHSLAAYFIGSETVTKYIFEGPSSHFESFTILMLVTVALFFNFAFFRERLCFTVCPYGRFQNAMIDANSLVVYYDAKRGEPRSKVSSAIEKKGSCLDCNRCVTVCPAKIDIRNGFQLECIACARCIDACNDVMVKAHRPPNLIRYETGDRKPISFSRFRLILYAGLLLFFSGFFAWNLFDRNVIDLAISRSHTEPFSQRFAGENKILQNKIVLHLKNQTEQPQQIQILLSPENTQQGYAFISPAIDIKLAPGEDFKTIAFIEIDELHFNPYSRIISIQLLTNAGQTERTLEFIKVD